jgi:hypothetical protein
VKHGRRRHERRPLPVDHLTVAGGWVWGTRGLVLYRIDPESGRVNVTISSTDLHGLAVGAGAVWVADPTRGRLLRVDPGF